MTHPFCATCCDAQFQLIPGVELNFPFAPSINHNQELKRNLKEFVDPTKAIDNTYEEIYTNETGIKVTLKGDYNDVKQVLVSLGRVPPSKYKTDPDKWIDIIEEKSTTLPPAPPLYYDKFSSRIVMIGNKKYSGSGALLIAFDSTDVNFKHPFVLLIKSNHNGTFEDLGGTIDKDTKKVPVDNAVLFTNAAKEAKEESALLFDLLTPAKTETEIESADTGLYYKVYVYYVVIQDLLNVPQQFRENLRILYNDSKYRDPSYRETSNAELFDLNYMIDQLKEYGQSVEFTSSDIFKTKSGNFVKVRGRTLRCLYKLFVQSGVYPVANIDKLVQKATLSVKADGYSTFVIS